MPKTDNVVLLEEGYSPGEASVRLAGPVNPGLSHGGAQQEGGGVYQDLEGVDLVWVEEVDLGVDPIEPGGPCPHLSVLHWQLLRQGFT